MSEQNPFKPEVEQKSSSPELEKTIDRRELAQEKSAAEADQSQKLREARSEIEKQIDSKQEALKNLHSNEVDDGNKSTPPVSADLKKMGLKRELKNLRKQLKPSDRLVSRVIHQPLVRVVSDVSAKTISRPSGLLGGGFLAFLGSSSYYLFAKHVGIKYNYLIFTMLFIVGFILGLLIEAIVWATHSRKKTS